MFKEMLQSGYNKTFGTAMRLVGRMGSAFSSQVGWIEFFYVVGIVAFMAGFVNAVFFPVANQAVIVYPGSGAQTIPEAVIDAFVIILGGGGIYATYLSGRQTTKSRMVNFYLALALLLIIVSVFMGIYLTNLKG